MMMILYYLERAYRKVKSWVFPDKKKKDRYIY